MLCISGCHPAAHTAGKYVEASMSFQRFSKSRTAERAAASGDAGAFNFPLLEVYDADSHLVYSGHDAQSNIRFLRSLPKLSFGKSEANPVTDRFLASTVEEIPQFRVNADELVRSHKRCVLSLSLKGCDACSVQDDALGGTKKDLLEAQINVLSIALYSERQ